MQYPIHQVRNNLYHYRTVIRRAILTRVWGMHIGENTRISSKARLDFTNPRGVHIGAHTSVTFDVAILTHDFVNNRHVDTYIGSYCFIGTGSIIMPGVSIGDHCIIGAGSVVTKDVPDRSIVAGNPARIVRSDIMTTEYGILAPSTQD
ncbi:acyltransferase [uncultured Aliiroseovarius sp.]|uniref:acyltransferase n=1 Tax=uncultured Aliiroseovarius sp. TaxID=1658783 RepID=UPI00259284C9|nr:acyltransferase [uncultured Aliiroseovarius sp.]